MNLQQVDYTITYNNKDITAGIEQRVLSVEYTDKVAGESDELEITLEDSEQLFQNDWYPEKGATLSFVIRQDGQQVNCGSFEIDEIASSCSDNGDVFTMRALGAGITKKLRTKSSYAHEDKSLREIANTVASNLKLTLQGTVQDIRFRRVHQYRETDLQFLNRISADYGYVFSVRGNLLVFTYYKEIEGREPSVTLTKQDLSSCDLKDTTHKTFKKCRIKHHDPLNKEVIEYDETETDSDLESDSADDLELRSRVENKQQAEAKAQYALYKGNSAGVGGDISLKGNLLVLSGNNIELRGLGQMSGIYQVLEAKHSINSSAGYTTSANLKRVKKIDKTYYVTK